MRDVKSSLSITQFLLKIFKTKSHWMRNMIVLMKCISHAWLWPLHLFLFIDILSDSFFIGKIFDKARREKENQVCDGLQCHKMAGIEIKI